MARARRRWIREQGLLDSSRLVFIDETSVNTNMTRPCGRGRRGERVIGDVPFAAWKTLTFVAALRCDRMTAPMMINGPMFTRVTACTLALSPIPDTLTEGFSHFVASMTAPVASGWSGCRVSLALTGKRRLVTAHTQLETSASILCCISEPVYAHIKVLV